MHENRETPSPTVSESRSPAGEGESRTSGMHSSGESDGAVVPMKPSNKATGQAPSDSPLLCMPDVRLSPSPAGLRLSLTVGDGVSRFSCIQFRGVPGVSDYVGPLSGSRSYAVTACCLPLQTTGSATSVCGFRSSTPCPSLPLSMLRTAPRDARRKTRGQDGFAAPFLSDSFIPYCMPVYPGARPTPL